MVSNHSLCTLRMRAAHCISESCLSGRSAEPAVRHYRRTDSTLSALPNADADPDGSDPATPGCADAVMSVCASGGDGTCSIFLRSTGDVDLTMTSGTVEDFGVGGGVPEGSVNTNNS